ncbi:hypothetical protein OAO18_00675 [Francisellaceae bacterium]|nr:hypothetical protein [Francisellaceae bacterium]
MNNSLKNILSGLLVSTIFLVSSYGVISTTIDADLSGVDSFVHLDAAMIL